ARVPHRADRLIHHRGDLFPPALSKPDTGSARSPVSVRQGGWAMLTTSQSRGWLTALLLAAALLLAQNVAAHHGWGWASDEEFELTGTITAVRLGNPHGEVTIDVDGEQWVVEAGQPWRNRRAGLNGDLLRIGQRITAHG